MELRHLRYFDAVARCLNFRRAADLLNVSQPSLSVQIRQLEEEIGVRLFERDTHRVTLTPVGAQFLEDARRILRETDESIRAAQNRERSEAGRLAIGFVPSLAYGSLSGILSTYRRRFPDIRLHLAEMDSTQHMQALQAKRIDVALVSLGLASKDRANFRQADIMTERLMAVLPEDHPLIPKRQNQTLSLAALAEERFILPARFMTPVFNPWLIMLCQQAGFQPKIDQEIGQPITALNLVAAGMGITLLPEQYSHFAIEGIRFIPLAKPVPGYRYCAVSLRQPPNPALVKFIEVAKAIGKSHSEKRGNQN